MFILIALIGGLILGFVSDRYITGWLESSQLYIIGITREVDVGKATNVTFITFGNDKVVSNASVNLDGSASGAGLTDKNGMLTLTVNATSGGNINITAGKTGYYNATSTMIAIPGLVISATPTLLTSNTASFVTFSASSFGKPVGDVLVNLSGAGISLDGVTNSNGEVVLQLNPPKTGAILAIARKQNYTEGSTTITSTSQQTLSVSSSHSAVTVNAPTYVTFTVTAAGSAVNDALVSLSGMASGSGITNQYGKAILLVTPGAAGTITVSASRTGYAGGSTTITSTGLQSLSITSNPATVTAGIPVYVTFTVTSGGNAVAESAVTLTGAVSGSGITNQNGQVILFVNSTGTGGITAIATKNGFSTGSMSLGVSGQQSLTITANPSSLTNWVTTYVIFTVTSAGSAVSGATVTASGGGVGGEGVTDSEGHVTLQLNAAGQGTISVTARKTGYIDGLTTIAH
ncbi:MAG: hypothetical protein FIB07_09900 [Candidatus Methanoperedens sp.]|nr:hypothetical protein [Candidatus Methanoperedens sp.]